MNNTIWGLVHLLVDHLFYNSLLIQTLYICANIELTATTYSPDPGINKFIFVAAINAELRKYNPVYDS